MFCPKCGAKHEDEANFCRECGQQIEKKDNNSIEINNVSVERESGTKRLTRLILSVIVGVVLGFLCMLLMGNFAPFLISALVGLLFAIMVNELLSKSNLHGLVAVIVFFVISVMYLYALSEINDTSYDIAIQDIALWLYISSPFAIWAMLLTEREDGASKRELLIKQLFIWVVLLLLVFVVFKYEVRRYLDESNGVRSNNLKEVAGEPNNDKTGTDTSAKELKDEVTDELVDVGYNDEYYLNSRGILVDKVEEFEVQIINGHMIKYPFLEDGVDEIVVYEFNTYDNRHVILDASNIYQQSIMGEGDYGRVEMEVVASSEDIIYMFGEDRYYIEDYSLNLITISNPMGDSNN